MSMGGYARIGGGQCVCLSSPPLNRNGSFKYERDKQLAVKVNNNPGNDYLIVVSAKGCVFVDAGAYVSLNMPVFVVEQTCEYYKLDKGQRIFNLVSGNHMIIYTVESPILFPRVQSKPKPVIKPPIKLKIEEKKPTEKSKSEEKKKVETKKEELKKEEPKKEAPKKVEPKKEEPKQEKLLPEVPKNQIVEMGISVRVFVVVLLEDSKKDPKDKQPIKKVPKEVPKMEPKQEPKKKPKIESPKEVAHTKQTLGKLALLPLFEKIDNKLPTNQLGAHPAEQENLASQQSGTSQQDSGTTTGKTPHGPIIFMPRPPYWSDSKDNQ